MVFTRSPLMSQVPRWSWSFAVVAATLTGTTALAQEPKDEAVVAQPVTSQKVELQPAGALDTPAAFIPPAESRNYVRKKMASLQQLKRLLPNKTPPKDGPVVAPKAAAERLVAALASQDAA